MCPIKQQPAQHGFTMIELLITMTILGILLATGIPSMTIWMANSRIRATAESIANGMQLARSEAIRRNVNIEFRLSDTQGSWTISSGSGCTFTSPTLIQDAPSTTATITVSRFSNVQATTATTAQVRIFGPNGWQACPATAQFVSLSIDSTALSATDSRDLRVVAPALGRARVCDPYSGIQSGDPRFCPSS